MFKKLINKGKLQKGFTIIEVMIVLAIAGLILVVVLIAIPQLQRNQRNSARQNDAARLATSVSNYMANNNGVAYTGTAAQETAIIADMGPTSQYGTLTAATLGYAAGGAAPVAANTSLTTLTVISGATCGASGATVPGTARQFVVQYATETSTSTATTGQGACLSV